MRENIIEQLRYCAAHFSCDGCGGKCSTSSNEPRAKAVLIDAADAIEELHDAVPHWISVEERLPDDFSRVLGFMAWGGMMLLERQSKGWYLADRIQQAPDEAVLYWMPLPSVPKEDAE